MADFRFLNANGRENNKSRFASSEFPEMGKFHREFFLQAYSPRLFTEICATFVNPLIVRTAANSYPFLLHIFFSYWPPFEANHETKLKSKKYCLARVLKST